MSEKERQFEHRVLEELAALRREQMRLGKEQDVLLSVARQIEGRLRPRLTRIEIEFHLTGNEDTFMAPVQGALLLTAVDQVATASVLGFDQVGAPMAADFKMPPISFSTADTAGAIVKVVNNGDGTASVTDVADGVTSLSAFLTTAEGLLISDTESVTVSNAAPPPPVQILSSIKIAFDGGTTAPTTTARKR